MQELFQDLISLKNVLGVLFITLDGKIMYQETKRPLKRDPQTINWLPFIQSISHIKEADLLFEKERFYIRQAYGGYILVSMTNGEQTSLVRLNCDLVMPTLKKMATRPKTSSKLSRLFKK